MDLQISQFSNTMDILSEVEETLDALESSLENKEKNIEHLKEVARRSCERIDQLIDKLDEVAK